jgi:MFS family permease
MVCSISLYFETIIFQLFYLLAVILPTALQYLQKFGGDEFYLGLCLSAYSLSSLFSSPIFGMWSDKYIEG